jgi:hypothetical protein
MGPGWQRRGRGRTDADEHLNEIAAGDAKERHPRLAGNGLGQESLAGAGRAHEQHSLGDAPAEVLVFLGVLQEVHDLLQLGLGLLNPGDVLEGDSPIVGRIQPVLGPPKPKRPAQAEPPPGYVNAAKDEDGQQEKVGEDFHEHRADGLLALGLEPGRVRVEQRDEAGVLADALAGHTKLNHRKCDR